VRFKDELLLSALPQLLQPVLRKAIIDQCDVAACEVGNIGLLSARAFSVEATSNAAMQVR